MKLSLSPRRLGKSLAWKLFPLADVGFTLKSGITIPIVDRSELATFRGMIIEQVWDPFLDALPFFPRTVLDLGCNCGYFPLLIHHRARLHDVDMREAHFVLVDANPRLVRRARDVIALNRLPGQFVFVSGLIGPRNQRVPFYTHPHSDSSSLFRHSSRSKTLHLSSLDLTQLLDAHFPGPVDLMKCNIEGGERYLVTDWVDALRRARAIVIEWHDFAMPWEEFAGCLQAVGFDLVSAEERGNFRVALFSRQ